MAAEQQPTPGQGINQSADVAAACSKYEFFWKAEPAFLPESTVTIVADGGVARSTITYRNVRNDVSTSEQLMLTTVASKQFCAELLRLIVTPQRKDDRRTWDGISIEGSFTTANAAPHKFSFRSPTRKQTPRDFGIADAVFLLFEKTTVSCGLNEYLERLAGYFQFGLPAKVITTEPLTLRFYGSFSLNHYQDIQTLLSKLSKSESVRIDVSNFEGMGTMYYPDFQRLISKVPDISWTATQNSARMLAEIGVKPEKMRLIEGPSCSGERVRFARQ